MKIGVEIGYLPSFLKMSMCKASEKYCIPNNSVQFLNVNTAGRKLECQVCLNIFQKFEKNVCDQNSEILFISFIPSHLRRLCKNLKLIG